MKKIILLLCLCLTVNSFAQTRVKVRKLALGGHSATLSWNAVTSTCSAGIAYNAYRGTAAGGENYTTPLNSTPGTALTYVDNTVNALSLYFYTIKAYCASSSTKESIPSNEVQANIPGDSQPSAPASVTVTSQ